MVDISMFYIADLETEEEKLIVTLLAAPSNGDIYKVTDGKDMKVKVGSNFTQDDIAKGKVSFYHHKGRLLRG